MDEPLKRKKFTAQRGAKVGGLISLIGWLFFVVAIVLSYVGLLGFMALANLMSVNNASWTSVLLDSPKNWYEIFGGALAPVSFGLLLVTAAMVGIGGLIGFALSRRPD